MTRGEILFIAEASIRYHRARADFFEALSKTLSIAILVMGGGAFATILANAPAAAPIAGLAIAILSAYRLAGKPDQCAAQHREWLRQWCEILGDVAANAAPTQKILAAWIRRRQRIDAECVGEMNALKAHCFNRTLAALGRRAKPYPLKFRHRAFKHFFRFTHAFDGIDFDPAR